MAGYGKMVEENRPERAEGAESRWIKPQFLIDNNVNFCLLDGQQDHHNQDGKPQITFYIIYAWNGQAVEKQFDVEASDWRMKNLRDMQNYTHDGHKGFAYHHLRLVRKPLRNGHSFLDFEDYPGFDASDPCVCDGFGLIDPEDPSTWTEHYKLSKRLNDALLERGAEPMDTGAMTEEGLRLMLKALAV